MVRQELNAVIFKDGGSDQWVAMCLEYDVVTQGDSAEHAREMIKEAVELYFEDRDDDDYYQPIDGSASVVSLSVDVSPNLSRGNGSERGRGRGSSIVLRDTEATLAPATLAYVLRRTGISAAEFEELLDESDPTN